MPTISLFFGIAISIRFNEHNPPHFHAVYNEYEAVFDFDGNILSGDLPAGKKKLVVAWVEIHKQELNDGWEMAKSGKEPLSIEPLR